MHREAKRFKSNPMNSFVYSTSNTSHFTVNKCSDLNPSASFQKTTSPNLQGFMASHLMKTLSVVHQPPRLYGKPSNEDIVRGAPSQKS